jgi:hypothetical protein
MVTLKHIHNHLLLSAASLRHRPVSADIKLKFLELYNAGLTPARALAAHQQDLQREYHHAYHEVTFDKQLQKLAQN